MKEENINGLYLKKIKDSFWSRYEKVNIDKKTFWIKLPLLSIELSIKRNWGRLEFTFYIGYRREKEINRFYYQPVINLLWFSPKFL
jgi:hypothetical protein